MSSSYNLDVNSLGTYITSIFLHYFIHKSLIFLFDSKKFRGQRELGKERDTCIPASPLLSFPSAVGDKGLELEPCVLYFKNLILVNSTLFILLTVL